MRFRDRARLDPSQIDDRRGRGRIPGAGRVPGGGKTVGGGAALVVVLLALLLGVPLGGSDGLQGLDTLDDVTTGQTRAGGSELASECRTGADANEREDCRIVGFVNSIQAYWSGEFSRHGDRYRPATTNFFTGETPTGCGSATSAVGPFYCPPRRVTSTSTSASSTTCATASAPPGARSRRPTSSRTSTATTCRTSRRPGARLERRRARRARSVRTELQADCFAGLWAHDAVATGYLEQLTEQDIADGLDAAAAVGDDRIQERLQGRVTPETWTHGSSAQRRRWFTTGYRTGRIGACDTFRGEI